MSCWININKEHLKQTTSQHLCYLYGPSSLTLVMLEVFWSMNILSDSAILTGSLVFLGWANESMKQITDADGAMCHTPFLCKLLLSAFLHYEYCLCRAVLKTPLSSLRQVQGLNEIESRTSLKGVECKSALSPNKSKTGPGWILKCIKSL